MKYCIALLLAFSPLCVLSQSNYQKGSITDNNSQNITGYINFHDWSTEPDYIEFKNSLDNKEPQRFYPTTIKSFTIDGAEKYNSCLVKISLNNTQYSKLSSSRDTSTKMGTVFLELIAAGDHVSMYSYTDAIKTRYYIQENNALPIELNYQEYYNETGTKVQTDKQYQMQLNNLAEKYDVANTRLVSKLEKTDYTSSDIASVVNDINGSSANMVKNNNGKRGKHGSLHLRPFIGASLNMYNANFNDGNNFKNSSAKGAAPQFYMGIDFISNAHIQNFIFRVEVAYNSISPEFVGMNYTTASGDFAEHYSYKQSNLSVGPQFIYNIYNKDAFKVFIGAGLAFNFSSYSNSKMGNVGVITSTDTPYKLESVKGYLPLQVGVVLNKGIEVFAGYTTSSVGNIRASIYDNNKVHIKNDDYRLGVRYLFGKN